MTIKLVLKAKAGGSRYGLTAKKVTMRHPKTGKTYQQTVWVQSGQQKKKKKDDVIQKDSKKIASNIKDIIPDKYHKTYASEIESIENAIKRGMNIPNRKKLLKEAGDSMVDMARDDWDVAQDWASKKVLKEYNNDMATELEVDNSAVKNIKKTFKTINDNSIDEIIFQLTDAVSQFNDER
jgi:hypothetical protein